MKRSLGFVVLAACSGPAANGIGNSGGPHAPAGPAPTIAWDDGTGFTLNGIPAIAADGSHVVYGFTDSDGGRGAPNLTLLVKDRGDQVAETHPVLALADDSEEGVGPTPDKVTEANKYLADSNQQYGWTALAGADAKPVGEGAEEESLAMSEAQEVDAPTGGVVLHFDSTGHLTITRGGATVFDKVEDGWLTKEYAPYDGAGPDEMCSNPAFLAHAYVDVEHALALVDIGYYGTDSCWEPADELHVVTW